MLVGDTVAANLSIILREEAENGEEVGPLLVAVLAGMVSAAGRLCASWEPSLDGDALSRIIAEQFNSGRADQFARDTQEAKQ
jgi:hypothetical protein